MALMTGFCGHKIATKIKEILFCHLFDETAHAAMLMTKGTY